jgi:hypothetical protein
MREKIASESEQEMADCIHHWDLGVPHESMIHAKCRKCGAEKDYPSMPISLFAIAQGRKKATQPPITPVRETPD